jgi:hypothetical protein
MGTAAALLVACAQTPEEAASGMPREVRVTDDRFRPQVSYSVQPPIQFGVGPQRSTSVAVTLIGGRARDTGARSFIAAVAIEYIGGSWAFFEEARGDDSRALNVIRGRRDVRCLTGGCIYTEEFGIGLSEADLRRAAQSDAPLVFKIFARRGSDVTVPIPAAYARALLARMGA